MKKCVILCALVAGPAYAHLAEPETAFFKEEIAKNPLTAYVLNFCSLAGLESEEECKDEMYEKNGSINSVKVDAASKCVKKSGMEHYARLDEFFKKSTKNQSWFAHPHPGTGKKHLFEMTDPAKPKDPPHYYFFTAADRYQAGLKMGDVFMDVLKRSHEGTISTTTSGSLSLATKVATDALIASGEISGSVTGGTSSTKGPLTAEQMKRAYDRGFEIGRYNPDFVDGIEPNGHCFKGGKCADVTQEFDEDQLNAKMFQLPKSEAEMAKNSSPRVPQETKADPTLGPGPFDPFTSGTATGGTKTEKEKESKQKEADKKPKNSNTTTLGPQDTQFLEKMQLRLAYEENQILKDAGVKHKDPHAKTDEERKQEAEQKLTQGYCDETYYGRAFCQRWKQEQHMTEEEDAAAKRKEAFDQALTEFQSGGGCNELILGWDFCKAAEDELNSTHAPDHAEEWGFDPWKPSHTNPANGGPGEGVGFGPVEGGRQSKPEVTCERDMFGDCKQ